jgi:hypothetical protein
MGEPHVSGGTKSETYGNGGKYAQNIGKPLLWRRVVDVL